MIPIPFSDTLGPKSGPAGAGEATTANTGPGSAGQDGAANRGGGGGGGGEGGKNGGNGGSGVVIIRFATQSRSYQALQSYADNAAAVLGGRLVGQFYRKVADGSVQQVQ